MKQYKIFLKKSNFTFYYDNRISLLAAIEQNGVQPQFGCRDGFCGSCCAKCLEGEWHYDGIPIAFVKEGQILLCCAIVDSDLVLDL